MRPLVGHTKAQLLAAGVLLLRLRGRPTFCFKKNFASLALCPKVLPPGLRSLQVELLFAETELGKCTKKRVERCDLV